MAEAHPGVRLYREHRADLRHIIEMLDVTPLPPSPEPPPGSPLPAPMGLAVPILFNVTPQGNTFTVVIPGANLAAGRTYQFRVLIDPADGGTPPHTDHSISITT